MMLRTLSLFALLSLTLLTGCSSGNGSPRTRPAVQPWVDLSATEQVDLDRRIKNFYASAATDPKVMDGKPPKFDLETHQFAKPNAFLQTDSGSPDPLHQMAGAKATPQFRKEHCDFVKQRFGWSCEEIPTAWAAVEADDRLERLLATWMEEGAIVKSMDAVPRTGVAEGNAWSDDYWKMKWGLTSYRYKVRTTYDRYHLAVTAYSQPAEWLLAMMEENPGAMREKVSLWSPSEKYDITSGNEQFTLTNQQKYRGMKSMVRGNVADWMGLCHGWSPAAIMVPTPIRSVNAVGINGTEVVWYPHDVRAMATLAWSNGDFTSNSVGGRCDISKTEKYPNGRLSQQQCFDTNPATLHLALANLIGMLKQSFIMDSTFDAEVWNQPILSYRFQYFNPIDLDRRSEDWREVAVNYDSHFKSRDRFQRPLTRGKKVGSSYDDSKIHKIVGVVATITYLAEVNPRHGETPAENATVRVSYTYDLELEETEGVFTPMGGEWHSNVHPDFLWIPQKGSTPHLPEDDGSGPYDLRAAASDVLTKASRRGALGGYPLCSVIKALVEASSGGTYHCKTP